MVSKVSSKNEIIRFHQISEGLQFLSEKKRTKKNIKLFCTIHEMPSICDRKKIEIETVRGKLEENLVLYI